MTRAHAVHLLAAWKARALPWLPFVGWCLFAAIATAIVLIGALWPVT